MEADESEKHSHERHSVAVSDRYVKWLKGTAAAGVAAPILIWGTSTFLSKDAGNLLSRRIEETRARVERVEQIYLDRSEKNTNRIMAHLDKTADRVTTDLRREIRALEERTLRAETLRDNRIETNRLSIEELRLLVAGKKSGNNFKKEN